MTRGAAACVARFDQAMDAAFERLRGRPLADGVFYAASAAGEHGLVWLAVALARARSGGRHRRAAARAAVALPLESLLVNGVIKSLFRRRRPAGFADPRPLPLRVPRTSSFPSGHASSAFCAAVLLGDGDRHWPLYVLAAAVVAASRIHVRIHHGSDVLAGALLGTAIGLLVRRIAPLPVDEES
jgi:undecaprenyl-diphosphatase